MSIAWRKRCRPSRLHMHADECAAPGLPRLVNLVAAGLTLTILGPFLGLIWLLIRLDSPGPGLFRQTRVGLDGASFPCFKFRSMRAVIPCDHPIAEHRTTIADFGQFIFNPVRRAPDPRLTRLGAILRRTSVDELPQLLNVIRGEMALVGPRPELPEIAAQYPPSFRVRQVVPPGITGVAQVNGRSDLTYSQSIAYDLDYVRFRSARLDIAILLRTLPAVIQGAGAR